MVPLGQKSQFVNYEINSQILGAGYAALLSLDAGKSTGSGFELKNDKHKFLVTAKHVLYGENDKIRCQSLTISFQSLTGREIDIEILDICEATVFHSTRDDLAIVLLASRDSDELDFTYKEYITIYETGTVKQRSIDSKDVKNPYEIGIGNDVFLIGYPTSLFFQNMQIFDIRRPLLRKG